MFLISNDNFVSSNLKNLTKKKKKVGHALIFTTYALIDIFPKKKISAHTLSCATISSVYKITCIFSQCCMIMYSNIYLLTKSRVYTFNKTFHYLRSNFSPFFFQIECALFIQWSKLQHLKSIQWINKVTWSEYQMTCM